MNKTGERKRQPEVPQGFRRYSIHVKKYLHAALFSIIFRSFI